MDDHLFFQSGVFPLLTPLHRTLPFLTTGIFDRAVLGADTYLSQGAGAGEVHADRRGRRAGDVLNPCWNF